MSEGSVVGCPKVHHSLVGSSRVNPLIPRDTVQLTGTHPPRKASVKSYDKYNENEHLFIIFNYVTSDKEQDTNKPRPRP